MKKEKWKDIPGFIGLYKVSNFGRIKSMSRRIKYNHPVTREEFYRVTVDKIMTPQLSNDGYCIIDLRKNNKSNYRKVHRLVMLAFYCDSKLDVNHIDGNKLNNNIDNLEYCTRSYNLQHAWRNGLKDNKYLEIEFDQFSLDGRFLKRWKGVNAAGRELGIFSENISACLNGKGKTAGGFIWRRPS